MCAPIVKDPAFTQHSRGWRIPLISNSSDPDRAQNKPGVETWAPVHVRMHAARSSIRASALARSRLLFLALVRLLACGRLRASGRTLAEEAQRVLHGMRHARLRLELRSLEIRVPPAIRGDEHGVQMQFRRRLPGVGAGNLEMGLAVPGDGRSGC